MQQEREHVLGAGQGHGFEKRADLLAQPARRDQHQPFGRFRELVRELHRHTSAEGVADQRDALSAQHREQVPDATRVRTQRVVAPGLRRVSVAQQVGSDHRVLLGQCRHDRPPRRGAPGYPMDQQDRRPFAGHPVADLVAVDPHGTPTE